MGYIIPIFFVLILSVTGFAEIMKHMIFRILKTPPKNTILLIIPAVSEESNIEYTLRCIGENVKWKSCLQPEKAVCITDNITYEDKQIATLVCSEYEFMESMAFDEFCKNLKENISKKDCLQQDFVL